MMNKNIHLIPALALGIAVLSIPTLATAATTINVVDPATLVAKGAGAQVSVEVTCDTGDLGSQLFANVSLTQRVGNSTANGSGGSSGTINCDGRPQTVPILVSVFGGKAFKKGPALAQASVSVCHPDFCENAQAAEEIRLR
jgi:hypothetical protein